MAKLIEKSPQKSVRRAAQQLGMAKTTVHKIMRVDLKLFPYKIQTFQPISQDSKVKRFEFANLILNMIFHHEINISDIWFSDEAHFYIDGYVNKQNWRFWGSENPYLVAEKSLHPRRITVWAALSSRGIIGPIFINENITANLYKGILEDSFVPFLQGIQNMTDFENAWFQQDGARPHRTQEVFSLLNEHFGKRVFALDYPEASGEGIEWPPYSPDLNPCDFYLWGFLKDRVYANRPTSIEELQDKIKSEIISISPEILQKVASSFLERLHYVISEDGGHFENIYS